MATDPDASDRVGIGVKDNNEKIHSSQWEYQAKLQY